MMTEITIDEIIGYVEEMEEDTTLSKSVRQSLSDVRKVLSGAGEENIKASKALAIMEDIADDANTDVLVKTKVWNVVSMLEKIG